MRDVAVLASAQTDHAFGKEQLPQEMVLEVTRAVLAAAGMDLDDVDTVVTAGSDVLDGRSICDAYTVEAAGGLGKDEVHVAEDGVFAALYAYLRLAGGCFDTALVVAHGKSSELVDPLYYSSLIFDPILQRPLGLNSLTACALQAGYFASRPGAREGAARVVEKNTGNAVLNPHSPVEKVTRAGEALTSGEICTPLLAADIPPHIDGACALLMAGGKRARRPGLEPAWIRGFGHCMEDYYLGHRDLSGLPACRAAASAAYRRAGIGEPPRDIQVAELSEESSFHELMLCEALGLCGDGGAVTMALEGTTSLDGILPVNPSGGNLGAGPPVVRGLIRLAEASRQVTGRAGKAQVKGARLALALGATEPCYQSCCAFILEGERR